MLRPLIFENFLRAIYEAFHEIRIICNWALPPLPSFVRKFTGKFAFVPFHQSVQLIRQWNTCICFVWSSQRWSYSSTLRRVHRKPYRETAYQHCFFFLGKCRPQKPGCEILQNAHSISVAHRSFEKVLLLGKHSVERKRHCLELGDPSTWSCTWNTSSILKD